MSDLNLGDELTVSDAVETHVEPVPTGADLLVRRWYDANGLLHVALTAQGEEAEAIVKTLDDLASLTEALDDDE